MCEQELPTAKKQRNTQAELLAILMPLLMFHDDLKGNSVAWAGCEARYVSNVVQSIDCE